MASFFYQDGAEPEARAASPRHLTAITGRRPTAPGSAKSQASSWPDSASERRTQVAPPDLFASSPSTLRNWVRQAWSWLWDLEELPRRVAPTTGLNQARNEFHSAIWDLQSLKANQLREQVSNARSLRELWHLRADVFKLISMHRGQTEAQLRLDVLNSHFPVRSSARAGGSRHSKITSW
jgi:hypothetical protein